MPSSPVTVKTPPVWISYWIAFSTCIVLWDAGYCFLRPRSMPGGDLSWIWYPYNMVPYSLIDLVYGIPALERGDGFTNAQALMNLIEATLNVEYLYLRHTSPKTLHLTSADNNRPKYHPQAPLVGFATVVMTAAKTGLYFLQEYYCGGCSIKQNTLANTLRYYVATNGIWLVVPLIVAVVLGQFIANALMRDVSNQIAYSEWSAGSTSSSSKSKPLPLAPTAPGEAKSSKKVSSGYAVPSPGAALPLTFNVASSSVLVIGSNRLAATRTFTLLEAGARVLVVSPLPITRANDEIQHRVEENGVVYFQVDFQEVAQWTMFMKGKKIALVCVTDTLIGSSERKEGSVETIAMACKALGVPVNVSDHPALSTFSFPATHRFSGAGRPSNLQISISTNGQGCRLGGRIKREIIAKLPSTVGAAVDNVGRLRLLAKEKGKGKAAMSEEDPSTPLNDPVEQLGTPSLLHSVSKELQKDYLGKAKDDPSQLRRMRWVHQMSEYYSFEALARMSEREMENALDTWQGIPTPSQPVLPHHDGQPLEQHGGPSRPKGKGRILLVGSGPGHPGLLTVAAHRALQSATLILSDKLVPAEVLALIPPTTALHIAKKFPGNNEGAQNELMVQALAAARSGETVVRLKQGDPFVYGRGGEEVLYFRENGYEAIVIPGVTSAIAGPEMVGIPITQRGVAESMVLCTGVGRAGKSISLPGYIKARSLVILMGVARIGSIVSTLTDPSASGRDGAAYPDYLPIAVIERASSPDQRVIVSTLRDIEAGIKSMEERPPGMMVVGWAVLALEGSGRVDVLDKEGDEEGISREWMAGDRWRVSEGLGEGFAEYLEEIGHL